MEGCTNILHNLSSKLQNYEMMQKKKDEEQMLEEIKENYKNIISKAKVKSKPSEIFSKYKEHMNLYN
jgi:23S rRNA pseudoU1915 N3-methylase RlmH